MKARPCCGKTKSKGSRCLYLDPFWWPGNLRTGREYMEGPTEGFADQKVEVRFSPRQILGQKPNLVAVIGWHQGDFHVTGSSARK